LCELLGAGVRLGFASSTAATVTAAGEGLETVMSLRMAMPAMPMIAGLSANHLAALIMPASLGRLYVAIDRDAAGRRAAERLRRRVREAGVEVLTLTPRLGDFNEDLRQLGLAALAHGVRHQLVPPDAARSVTYTR
jgi:hypothetical protein